MDANADCNGDCLTGFTLVDGSCVAEILGCTDETACNYRCYADTDGDVIRRC